MAAVLGKCPPRAMDSTPAGGLAIIMELLLPGPIIGIEDVFFIAIPVIHPGIGDTNQLQYLHSRACPTLSIIAMYPCCILVRTFDLYQVYGRTPDIHRHTLGCSIGM